MVESEDTMIMAKYDHKQTTARCATKENPPQFELEDKHAEKRTGKEGGSWGIAEGSRRSAHRSTDARETH